MTKPSLFLVCCVLVASVDLVVAQRRPLHHGPKKGPKFINAPCLGVCAHRKRPEKFPNTTDVAKEYVPQPIEDFYAVFPDARPSPSPYILPFPDKVADPSPVPKPSPSFGDVISNETFPFYWERLAADDSLGASFPSTYEFEENLYVFATKDGGEEACGPRYAKPAQKKQGSGTKCTTGIVAFSQADGNLRSTWESYGTILAEEDVPWAWRGAEGWNGSARIGGSNMVMTDDGISVLFFSAPINALQNAIGYAVSLDGPTGPFVAHPRPISGTFGHHVSVVRDHDGKWLLFTSEKAVFVQALSSDFQRVSRRVALSGLPRGDNYAPHALMRHGRLWLYYSNKPPAVDGSEARKVRVMQAPMYNPCNITEGVGPNLVAIDSFDGRSNTVSVVDFRGRSFAFYHRHMEDWRNSTVFENRMLVISPVNITCRGEQVSLLPNMIWYQTGRWPGECDTGISRIPLNC